MVLNGPFQTEDFKKCADFHGHICPGLSIGYRASQRAMEWLRENRAEDEEIVAIVETNACGADAVQVLTGCTFGKGNLIFRDHGKQVLTLLSRKSGEGVRVALKAGALGLNEEHRQLVDKVRKGDVTDIERKRFQELHLMRSRSIMEKSEEALFDVRQIHEVLPPKARIEPSKPCDRCGEPTMASRLSQKEGMKLCGGCLKGQGGWENRLDHRLGQQGRPLWAPWSGQAQGLPLQEITIVQVVRGGRNDDQDGKNQYFHEQE